MIYKIKRTQHPSRLFFLLAGIVGLALTFVGSANAAPVLLFQESFETDGDDVDGDGRYTVINQHITLEQEDFNDRALNNSTGLEIAWGTLDGDWLWHAKDLGETGPGIEGSDLTGADQGRTTWLAPIDISGVGNLKLTVAMAVEREEQEPNNMVAFEYRIDGGDWVTFGGHRGLGQQGPNHVWVGAEVLSNPNQSAIFPDGSTPRCVPSFRDFEFPIYDVGDSMEFRVYVASNGNHGGFGYDNLRITGDDAAASMTVALNKATFAEGTDGAGGGTFTVTLGTTAPAGGLTISVWDDDEDNTEADIPSTISVAEGQTGASVNFDILDDGRFDGDEGVRVTFSAPGYAQTQARLTVTNDPAQVAPDIVINEVYTTANLQQTVGDLSEDANNDGVSDRDDDEFIEIVNNEATDVDISGFKLWNANNGGQPIHTFPAGTILPAGGAAVVFGFGDPRGNFGGANVGTSSIRILNLNNGSDTISVRSGSGIVSEVSLEATEFGDPGSGTRNPDITGDFVPHTTVNSSSFTPGTKVDGSSFISYTDALTLSLDGETVAENAGTVEGTVSVANAAPSGGITVNLSASHHLDHLRLSTPTKVTVPASVTIAEGATSAVFTVTAVDNDLLDGEREMDIRASADGIMPAIEYVTVVDNEADPYTVVINEAFGHVFRSGLDPNGNGRVEEHNEDQYIEIVNAGESDVNLTGWTVHSWRTSEPGGPLLVHEFDGTVLPASGSLLLWGGSNDPASQKAQAAEIQSRSAAEFGGAIHVVASKQHGINLAVEDSQRIVLQTPDGLIENEFRYSTPNSESPESVTRAPDLTGDDDQLHLEASGLALLALSPGAMIDGTFFAGNGITSEQVLGGSGNPVEDLTDWYWSPWFGFYNTTFDNWIFHAAHGFLYQDPGSVTGGSLFFYDPPMTTWWWTTEASYPFMYVFDPGPDNNSLDVDVTWVFYFDDDVNPRIFATVPGGEFLSFDMSL